MNAVSNNLALMRDYVDYVKLHSVMNIMAENSDKMNEHRAIVVFSY